MRKWNAERGMSLVEATIILMVLSILTAVVAPSIADYTNDARQVKVKEDTEAIGTAILRLLRDIGGRCLLTDSSAGCTKANRVDLLTSGGTDPLSVSTADAAPDADAVSAGSATPNWLPDANAPAGANLDTMDDQLIENDNGTPYSGASFTAGGGPQFGIGWRGAYVNGPITGDPWGRKYQANTLYTGVASDATDAAMTPDHTTEGLKYGGWNVDVMVMSAGANGIVETAFGSSGSSSGGDDSIYVLRGSTR